MIDKIVQWHKDRNLIEGSTDEKQFVKLLEEVGELVKLKQDLLMEQDLHYKIQKLFQKMLSNHLHHLLHHLQKNMGYLKFLLHLLQQQPYNQLLLIQLDYLLNKQ